MEKTYTVELTESEMLCIQILVNSTTLLDIARLRHDIKPEELYNKLHNAGEPKEKSEHGPGCCSD